MKTLTELLSFFEHGDIPTQSQFEELIRTMFELFAAAQTTANAAVTTANTALAAGPKALLKFTVSTETIVADKWKRITFLYTTGEYLLKAHSLNDLVVDGDERQLLWHSLRERAENEQLYKTDLPEVDIPPEVLMALLGIKDVQVPYDAKDDSDGDFD